MDRELDKREKKLGDGGGGGEGGGGGRGNYHTITSGLLRSVMVAAVG